MISRRTFGRRLFLAVGALFVPAGLNIVVPKAITRPVGITPFWFQTSCICRYYSEEYLKALNDSLKGRNVEFGPLPKCSLTQAHFVELTAEQYAKAVWT